MRKFIFLAGAVLLVFIMLGIASGAAIAKTGPFLPGSLFFPIQNFSEQAQARLQSPAERRTEAFLNLAERRIENLTVQTGTPQESESLAYLDAALDQAVQSWAQLPKETADEMRDRMIFLLKASEIAANRLTVISTQNPDQLAAFLAKMATLQSLAEASAADPVLLASLVEGNIFSSPAEISEQTNLLNATIDPMAVPFPAGSVASEHAFYPLIGQHAQIACESCHSNGVYEGTSTYCEACHSGVKPDPHYAGDCAACHSPGSWSDISFDHTLVATFDCVSCHQTDKPANHFGNQCAACHATTTWKGASFNHQAVGATNCQSCHANDKPTNHFGGQCSACHSTNSWKGASFNHQAAGATDCQSCHSKDKPSNHFSGQCSACHSTNNWDAEFNHSGQTDCKSCHSNDKPSNHFSGQCSACHSTNSWKGASFNHSGQTDCQSCHSKDKPSNHFSGQCSACHSTNNWDAEFNHSGQTDCKSCHSNDKPSNHFSGQCSACHSTNTWKGASFSHSGQTDCQSCHSNDKPSNHFSGQCSACHSTNDWDAEFNHSGQTDCKACHSGDRPSEHSNEQCSECHNTRDWDDADDDDDGGDDGDDGGDGDSIGENGNLEAKTLKMAAVLHSPLACETCHQPGQTNFNTVQSKPTTPWWQTILTIFRNMVPLSIG